MSCRLCYHFVYCVACKDKYLIFEFEDNFLAVLEREAAAAASPFVLKDYGIPCERSSDLLEPFIDLEEDKQILNQDIGDSPVSNFEIGFDGLLWAWNEMILQFPENPYWPLSNWYWRAGEIARCRQHPMLIVWDPPDDGICVTHLSLPRTSGTQGLEEFVAACPRKVSKVAAIGNFLVDFSSISIREHLLFYLSLATDDSMRKFDVVGTFCALRLLFGGTWSNLMTWRLQHSPLEYVADE